MTNVLHAKFKLNGSYFTDKELYDIASGFVNEKAEYLKETGTFLQNWLDDKDYVKVQTSGTTGKPKLINVKKQAMVNSALASGMFFDLQSGNSALCCLPVKYIAGKMMLVRAMVLGLEIDLVEPKSNPLEKNDRKYDFVAMVPLQVENSLDKLNQIGQLLIGGAKVNLDLGAKIMATKCKAYETYSMTETVTHVAAKRVGNETFTVLPNVTISTDNRGCLIIDAPELNSDKIITNDLVTIISETEFIWNGRVDNVINSGGIKLFPEAIEEKISRNIIQRFFVGGIPDEKLGEKVVLVVEGEECEIDQGIFETLTKYEKPKNVFFITEFLETETGKIKRKEILKQLAIKNPA